MAVCSTLYLWHKARTKATTNKTTLHRTIRKILQSGNVRKHLSLFCLCEPHCFKILGHAYCVESTGYCVLPSTNLCNNKIIVIIKSPMIISKRLHFFQQKEQGPKPLCYVYYSSNSFILRYRMTTSESSLIHLNSDRIDLAKSVRTECILLGYASYISHTQKLHRSRESIR